MPRLVNLTKTLNWNILSLSLFLPFVPLILPSIVYQLQMHKHVIPMMHPQKKKVNYSISSSPLLRTYSWFLYKYPSSHGESLADHQSRPVLLSTGKTSTCSSSWPSSSLCLFPLFSLLWPSQLYWSRQVRLGSHCQVAKVMLSSIISVDSRTSSKKLWLAKMEMTVGIAGHRHLPPTDTAWKCTVKIPRDPATVPGLDIWLCWVLPNSPRTSDPPRRAMAWWVVLAILLTTLN